eukprot:3121499-Pyramimonas_sp.AAC.1
MRALVRYSLTDPIHPIHIERPKRSHMSVSTTSSNHLQPDLRRAQPSHHCRRRRLAHPRHRRPQVKHHLPEGVRGSKRGVQRGSEGVIGG